MTQAYEFALDKIGMDIYSCTIWNDYINFLKSVSVENEEKSRISIIDLSFREANSSYEENQKIAAVRKVYQKAIMTPMISVESLWKDYCNYEMVRRTLNFFVIVVCFSFLEY